MNKSEQPDNSVLYVRAGDGDGYNDFTDLESAIDYLQEVTVTGPLTKYDAYQYESPSVNSKISLYWGEQTEMANPVRSLSVDELKLINLALPVQDQQETETD